MHLECTNGSPILDTLDHLPPLPLFVSYTPITVPTEQDELGICHALRQHDRVRHIKLVLLPSILHNVVMLMGERFPMLEHLSLSFAATIKHSRPLTLPKAFLAPNLLHLALVGIGLPKRLRVLTSTDSLVTLKLSKTQASSYFRPRVLVARLASLPKLKVLSIEFSVPIPRPRTERELLGENGTPVTLPSLKRLQFKGVSAYLESLIAQIRVPLLEQLEITLFNQIAIALPHLSYLISITGALKLPRAIVGFDHKEVYVTMAHNGPQWFGRGPFLLRVMCKPLDWQIDCAAQICHTLIPALSGVERFRLICYHTKIPTEWRNGAVDATTWHELLRSFTGMKELYVDEALLEDLSWALQVDEVGSDPAFLPNLRSINAARTLFSSFIDTRQIVGRPVAFSLWRYF